MQTNKIDPFKNIYISPLFNQVGQLRTSSHLQMQPGQDKAKPQQSFTLTNVQSTQ